MKAHALNIRFVKITGAMLVFITIIISSSVSAQLVPLIIRNLEQKKNKNAAGQNNGSQTKSNAALSKKASTYTSADIEDASGIWEGEVSDNNTVWYYKLSLFKTGDNTYSGVDTFYLERNVNNTPVRQKIQAQQTFLAKYNSSTLNYSWVSNTEGYNFVLLMEQLRFVNDNGNIVIVNGNNNQPARMIYLERRSNIFPAEEMKYVITENTLQIINPVFKNSVNESVLKFNDHGQLTLSLKNTSDMDLNNIKGQITTTESENGILGYDQLFSTFSIPKSTDSAVPLTININTGFSVPAGNIHLNIVFTYNELVLAKKTLEIPAVSFYKVKTFTSPEYTSYRMKAVAGYYGFSNTPFTDVSKSLEPLIASGDKMASMWKAILLSTGRGQYKFDGNSAYNIGKSDLSFIEEKARNGDGEALYLLFYACQMGLEGESAETLSYDFLLKSASAGFMPAVYDAALNDNKQKDYTDAFQSFQKLYNDGMKKAANTIGMMYEQGFGVNKDVNTAIEWYKKGIAFGDPEAMLSLANVYSKGFEDTPPDVLKAIALATQAASKNCPDAMVFLGRKYFDGKQGVAKNIPVAFKWFKEGADLGDRKAILALGETYLSDDASITKDEQSGLFWIKKAAELGSPKAMMILWANYSKGMYGDVDVIAARYWYNQAVIAGYATADETGTNAQAQTFLDFIDNADFSPSYIYVNEYGTEVGDSGDGLLKGVLEGVLASAMDYYGQQQQLIDGLEYICKKNGNKIYGGTVSSYFISNLYLKQGQTINVKSYGTVSTGMMSGLATADGLGNSWQEYAFVKGIPCSAVMAEVKNGTWQFIGQKKLFTATNDGPFVIALNGIDYRNYKGYFDIVVQLPDN